MRFDGSINDRLAGAFSSTGIEKMSKYGMIVAGQFAHDLPEFSGLPAAEEALLALRDKGLQELHLLSGLAPFLDYSSKSLKSLESWFFENGQPAASASGYSIAHAIGFYFGELLCRNQNFQWVVREFAFVKGRYEIGVERQRLAIMLTEGKHLELAGNKRMQSLWREYESYAS
jgi:hypothetical protein